MEIWVKFGYEVQIMRLKIVNVITAAISVERTTYEYTPLQTVW